MLLFPDDTLYGATFTGRNLRGKELATAKIKLHAEEGNGRHRNIFIRTLTCWKGNAMEHIFTEESTSLLHELDLGQHTLLLYDDGSIDLLANDEHTPYLAENGLRLDSDETYRLFVSLQSQFQHQ